MRRTTATTDYLKECMGTALLELMKEKPIEKISIEEMTAKADVALVNRFFFLVLGEIRSTGTAMVSRRILETSGTMSGSIWCVSSLSGATKKTCSINSWSGRRSTPIG